MQKAIRLQREVSKSCSRFDTDDGEPQGSPTKVARMHSWEEALRNLPQVVIQQTLRSGLTAPASSAAWKAAFTLTDKTESGSLDHAEVLDAAKMLLDAAGSHMVPQDSRDFNALVHRRAEDGVDAKDFEGFYHRFVKFIAERALLSQCKVNSEDTAVLIDGTLAPGRQCDALHAVLTHCPTFTSLSVRNAKELNDSTLRTVLQQVKTRLTFLDLSGSSVDDTSAKAIAAFCPNLRSLRLTACSVTDESMAPIAKFCRGLRELDIAGCLGISEASLGLLPISCHVTRHSEAASPVTPTITAASAA